MGSNVGHNPYKGPQESRLEQVIADISRADIEQGANSWRTGSSELAQVRVELLNQAGQLTRDGAFGEPGIQAAAVFEMIAEQVAKHEEGMEAVAKAIDVAAVALGEAENTTLPIVQPAPNFADLPPDADNVWLREQAKEASHKRSLSEREVQSRKAMQQLDEQLNDVARALRELTGVQEPTRPGPRPTTTPVHHTPGSSGPGLAPPPQVLTNPGWPKDPPQISDPGLPEGWQPGDDDTEGTDPHTPQVVTPTAPSPSLGPGLFPGPGATSPGSGPGIGVPATTGLAAGVLSTAAVFGGIRRTPPPVTGLAPGATPGQIGRSTTPARGNLGRPGLAPGQAAGASRTGGAPTRGAGARPMAPGQAAAGSRAAGRGAGGGRAGAGRGATPVAGTGGRQGGRDKDDRSREALAFEDQEAWLDDDAHGAGVLD